MRCASTWRAAAVVLDGGDEIAYDRLIVATGAANNYFGNDAWAAHAPSLKTLEDAYEIRRRVLLAFERAERETDTDEARRLAHLRGDRRRRDRRRTGGRLRRDRAPYAARRIPPLRPAQRARGAGRRRRARAADLSAGRCRSARAASSSAWASRSGWAGASPASTPTACRWESERLARRPWCGRPASPPPRSAPRSACRSTARGA